MSRRLVVVGALTAGSIAIPATVVVVDALTGWPNGPVRTLYATILVPVVLVGGVIASRRPGNAIGPAFLTFGLMFAWYLPIDILASQPDPAVAVRVAAVLSSASDAPMFILVAWVLLLFPDGQLPSPRWRWTIWLGAVAIPVGIVGFLFQPGPIVAFAWLDNPLGVAGFPSHAMTAFAYGTLVVLLVAAAMAMVRRFRSGDGVVRAQVKWVACAALLLVIAEVGNLATFNPADPYAQPIWLVAASIALALVPVAIGVAILRHRLYDIDVVIRRTLVYGALVGVLGVVYAGLVLVLQALLSVATGGDTAAVALSTLAIAALFGPLRARVRAFIDRRFYRSRYDAARTLATFSARLRDEVDVDAVGQALVAAARTSVHPGHADVWVRPGTGR